jgi:hypothetical protein
VDGRGGVPAGPAALTLALLLLVVYTLRMTWIEKASPAEFAEEMRRKPDAHLLVEWLDVQMDRADRHSVDAAIEHDYARVAEKFDELIATRAAIQAYLDALEDA